MAHHTTFPTLESFTNEKKEKILDHLSQITFGFLPCDLQLLGNHITNELINNPNHDEKQLCKLPNFVKNSASPSFSIQKSSPVYWDSIGGLEAIKVASVFIKEKLLLICNILDYIERKCSLGLWTKTSILENGDWPNQRCFIVWSPWYWKNNARKSYRDRSICHIYKYWNQSDNKCLRLFLSIGFSIPIKLTMFHIWLKIGESEKILSEIFQQAKDNAPSVIFFDEIDALFGHRESDESATSACQMVIRLFLWLPLHSSWLVKYFYL